MRNIYKVLALLTIVTTQQVFADDTMMQNDAGDKPCASIAKACLSAGYVVRKSETKGIWQNCMKPVLLGQTVSNVSVDPVAVKACRTHKIKEMQMQLEQFKNVK